jgi:hypothetical protein
MSRRYSPSTRRSAYRARTFALREAGSSPLALSPSRHGAPWIRQARCRVRPLVRRRAADPIRHNGPTPGVTGDGVGAVRPDRQRTAPGQTQAGRPRTIWPGHPERDELVPDSADGGAFRGRCLAEIERMVGADDLVREPRSGAGGSVVRQDDLARQRHRPSERRNRRSSRPLPNATGCPQRR